MASRVRPASAVDPELERAFHVLAESWRRNTRILSSVTAKAMDGTYQQIIGMGPAALPLIFGELRKQPDHWFWALRAITREDPVPPQEAGDIERMRAAWLRYGEEHGYL